MIAPRSSDTHAVEVPSPRELPRLLRSGSVDGATLLNDQFELLAFGAKISRARGRPLVEQVAGQQRRAGQRRAHGSGAPPGAAEVPGQHVTGGDGGGEVG